MDTVELKNGATEAKALVTVTVGSLRHLIETNPIAFYELVQKARDKDHKIWGNASSTLESLALLSEGGAMHESIRNIVLSAAEGDGLDMALISPIKTVLDDAPKIKRDDSSARNMPDELVEGSTEDE